MAKEDIKDKAIHVALAEVRLKHPHAKRVSIHATEDDDASGKRFVRVTAEVDGKRVELDS